MSTWSHVMIVTTGGCPDEPGLTGVVPDILHICDRLITLLSLHAQVGDTMTPVHQTRAGARRLSLTSLACEETGFRVLNKV